MDNREQREALLTFTGNAAGFRAFFSVVIKPQLDQWKHDLAYNSALTKAEMRARQLAIEALETSLVDALQRAKITLPDWLTQELKGYEWNEQ